MLADNSNFREAEHIGEDLLNRSGANTDSKCRSVDRAVGEGIFTLAKALKLYKVPQLAYESFLKKKVELEHRTGRVAKAENRLFAGEIRRDNDADVALRELFIDELKDIYWAEKHLLKALPKMRKASSNPELAAAFDNHAAETQRHVDTLERVFELLGEKVKARKCNAMAELISDTEDIIMDTEPGTMVREVGLIGAAQKIEHYEIASYGTLKTLASTLGHADVSDLLMTTLENEKATDSLLSSIADGLVNLPFSAKSMARDQKLPEEKTW